MSLFLPVSSVVFCEQASFDILTVVKRCSGNLQWKVIQHVCIKDSVQGKHGDNINQEFVEGVGQV